MAEVSSADVEQWDPLVCKLAYRISRRYPNEYDDLVQEGRIHVWHSLQLGYPPDPRWVWGAMQRWASLVDKQIPTTYSLNSFMSDGEVKTEQFNPSENEAVSRAFEEPRGTSAMYSVPEVRALVEGYFELCEQREKKWLSHRLCDLEMALEALPRKFYYPVVLYGMFGCTTRECADALTVSRWSIIPWYEQGLAWIVHQLNGDFRN